jgi:hypothetical protein
MIADEFALEPIVRPLALPDYLAAVREFMCR